MRAPGRRIRAALTRRSAAIARAVASVAGELLVGVVFLVGWLLVAKGLVALTHQPAVWPLSIGALLLSLCGWGYIRDVFRDGLFVLYLSAKAKAADRG